MLGSTVVEVGIGMALLFLFSSLIATAAQEFLEGLLQKRGKDLERGIRELLDESTTGDLTTKFYNHPLVASLYAGRYQAGSRHLPSYIPSSSFALAILDILARGHPNGDRKHPGFLQPTDAQGYWDAAASCGHEKVSRMVLTALEISEGDIGKTKQTLEAAFDATMDRVSGWYKRRTQWVLATIGLFMAVTLNIDAVTVAQRLLRDDTLRKSVVASAAPVSTGQGASPGKGVDALKEELTKIGYPMGWRSGWPDPQKDELSCDTPDPFCATLPAVLGGRDIHLLAAFKLLVGWLATALAIMLGAPFWFDVLNKFMVIRSTVKPNEKSQPEGSADRQTSPTARLHVELKDEQ